jgi:Xaa-Pro dipeptidase
LHYARGIKSEYELAAMRLASQRGVTGHAAAESAFRNGASEFEIHRAYCKAVSHTDPELPYGNIIAVNDHSAVLHYTDFDRDPPAQSRSFLIDAGAEVHGYASDITRTYSNGDEQFQALIERMEAMEQEIVAEVSAGVDYRDLHVGTHKRLAAVLVDAELASGDADTLLETGVTSAFFPHGVGHLLGIQVHDVGGFMEGESGTTIDPPSGHPYLRLTRVLEENMVLTIEPGLYAIDMLLENLRGTPAENHVNWNTVDWLRPFGGIRIEDNVRVQANGQENLTRDAFAQL